MCYTAAFDLRNFIAPLSIYVLWLRIDGNGSQSHRGFRVQTQFHSSMVNEPRRRRMDMVVDKFTEFLQVAVRHDNQAGCKHDESQKVTDEALDEARAPRFWRSTEGQVGGGLGVERPAPSR